MGILTALSKTSILNPQSKLVVAKLIVKEFANPNTTEERANELIFLAYQFNIPQLEEMMSQCNFDNKLNNILWRA